MTPPLCLHCGHGYGQHDGVKGACYAGRPRSAPCPCQGYEPGDLPDLRPNLYGAEGR